LTRVYFKEGRLDDAVGSLQRAASASFKPPAPRWTVAWFNGLVNKQNGFLDKAIVEFRSILEDHYPELEERGFDFSKDYEVINELGQTLFERAKLERGGANQSRQRDFLLQAMEQFKKTLKLDQENLAAHYNLALIYTQLGDQKLADEHRKMQSVSCRPERSGSRRGHRQTKQSSGGSRRAGYRYLFCSVSAPELGGTTNSPGVDYEKS
jgi:tetratricopeptide (TPR) repeat protein